MVQLKNKLNYFYFVIKRKGIFGLLRHDYVSQMKEENRSFAFLHKHFYNSIELIDKNVFKAKNESKYIWFCWLDGIDNAPDIVKTCYSSLKLYNSDKSIVFIDKYNYNNYIEIPDYIVEKWKNGIICGAHFCDLMRIMLLSKYGGVWSDSTCFYTSKIPDYLYNESIFFFSNERKRSDILISNWYIMSSKNNPIITELERLLLLYWKTYNAPIHYFFFHMLLSLIYKKNNFTNNEYLVISNLMPQALNHELNNEFSVDKLKIYSDLTFVHKLNRKTCINYNDKGNFYNSIIKKL